MRWRLQRIRVSAMIQNGTANQASRRPASSTGQFLASRGSAFCSYCNRVSLASSRNQRDKPGIIENKGQLRNMHARSLVASVALKRGVPRCHEVVRPRCSQVVSWHKLCARHRLFGGTGRGGSKKVRGSHQRSGTVRCGNDSWRVAVVVRGIAVWQRAGKTGLLIKKGIADRWQRGQ